MAKTNSVAPTKSRGSGGLLGLGLLLLALVAVLKFPVEASGWVNTALSGLSDMGNNAVVFFRHLDGIQ